MIGHPEKPEGRTSGFIVNENGMWHFGPKALRSPQRSEGASRDLAEDDGDGETQTEWKWLAPPFAITARSTDEDAFWGKVLLWKDPDGNMVQWAMDGRLLGKPADLWPEFYERGLEISTEPKCRALLLSYLVEAKPSGRARLVERLGWHTEDKTGRPVFVLPDATYSNDTIHDEFMFRGGKANNPYQVKGTVEDWREHIGRVCVGNSRLVLAASTAFASPLLYILGELSGGFHFVGDSSKGKTTAIIVGNSVGCPPTGLVQWRGTANGIEAKCAERCDGLLPFDEMGQVDAKEAGEIVYLIANNRGKSRMTRNAEARKAKEWRVLVLSSGEITLADKMAEVGKKSRAGQEVRLINVSADAGKGMGIFEDLHGAQSGGAFSDQLKSAAQNCYGAPLRGFLAEIARQFGADPESIRAALREMHDDFVREHVPSGASGQVRSACGRFATIAVAGELATGFGLTGWPEGEATNAAVICFESWLQGRGTTGDHDLEAGIQQVISMIERHGSSRFETLGSDLYNSVVHNRIGFRKRINNSLEIIDHADAEYMYLVFPNQWRDELCKGYNANQIAEEMARRGLLIREGDQPHGRFDAKSRCGKAGTLRMYQIRLPQQSTDTRSVAERQADWIRREFEINADVPDHLATVEQVTNGYDGVPDDRVPVFPTAFPTVA
jgi:putative DNA primase/helicase